VKADARAFLSSGMYALLSTAIATCAPCLLIPGQKDALRTPVASPSAAGGCLQLDSAARLSCLMGKAEAFSLSRLRFQKCFLGCDGLCSTLNLFKRDCMSSGLLELLMDRCFNCTRYMTEHSELWLDGEQFRAVYLWQLEKKLCAASLKAVFFFPF